MSPSDVMLPAARKYLVLKKITKMLKFDLTKSN